MFWKQDAPLGTDCLLRTQAGPGQEWKRTALTEAPAGRPHALLSSTDNHDCRLHTSLNLWNYFPGTPTSWDNSSRNFFPMKLFQNWKNKSMSNLSVALTIWELTIAFTLKLHLSRLRSLVFSIMLPYRQTSAAPETFKACGVGTNSQWNGV